jgi:hypothetical protein
VYSFSDGKRLDSMLFCSPTIAEHLVVEGRGASVVVTDLITKKKLWDVEMRSTNDNGPLPP